MLRLISIAALLLAACDGGAGPAPAEPAKAAVEPEPKPAGPTPSEKLAAEKTAKEAEEKQVAATLDTLAVLPEKVPRKLGKACKQMLAAYDGHMRKHLTGDMLTKWETGGNEAQLTLFGRDCKKSTPKVAACQAHGLKNLDPAMNEHLSALMLRCREKFGPGAEAKAPG